MFSTVKRRKRGFRPVCDTSTDEALRAIPWSTCWAVVLFHHQPLREILIDSYDCIGLSEWSTMLEVARDDGLRHRACV